MNPEIDLEFWWIVNKSNYEICPQNICKYFVFCISLAGGITAKVNRENFCSSTKQQHPSFLYEDRNVWGTKLYGGCGGGWGGH